MTNDDGRCKKNGANEDAGDHDGDEQSFETDDPRHDEATHCEGEEEVTNTVGQQVEMSDSLASCSHWVVVGGVHVIDGRRMSGYSANDYKFVGSNRVR